MTILTDKVLRAHNGYELRRKFISDVHKLYSVWDCYGSAGGLLLLDWTGYHDAVRFWDSLNKGRQS